MLKFSSTVMFGIVLILEDCALSTSDQLCRADSKGECRAVSKDVEILLRHGVEFYFCKNDSRELFLHLKVFYFNYQTNCPFFKNQYLF